MNKINQMKTRILRFFNHSKEEDAKSVIMKFRPFPFVAETFNENADADAIHDLFVENTKKLVDAIDKLYNTSDGLNNSLADYQRIKSVIEYEINEELAKFRDYQNNQQFGNYKSTAQKSYQRIATEITPLKSNLNTRG